jgi:hypothetical protein
MRATVSGERGAPFIVERAEPKALSFVKIVANVSLDIALLWNRKPI